jgi:hypothetical protein
MPLIPQTTTEPSEAFEKAQNRRSHKPTIHDHETSRLKTRASSSSAKVRMPFAEISFTIG